MYHIKETSLNYFGCLYFQKKRTKRSRERPLFKKHNNNLCKGHSPKNEAWENSKELILIKRIVFGYSSKYGEDALWSPF